MTIKAQIIADSINEEGVRLTTMAVTYPRMIHSELMTHRVFSRNASSSRAIPIKRMIQSVIDDPAMPSRWGKANKGMQDGGELSEMGAARTKMLWLAARDDAVNRAKMMISVPEDEPAKQVVNRILEPFAHITVLITSTYWQNWYALRDHPDADPTIAELAQAMRNAHTASVPGQFTNDGYHLPFIKEADVGTATAYCTRKYLDNPAKVTGDLGRFMEKAVMQTLCEMSTARCARVSYLNFDGRTPPVEEDVQLFEKLMGSDPLHASPAEHIARPDWKICVGAGVRWAHPHLHGNFVGWRQFRKEFAGEFASEYESTLSDVLTALAKNETRIEA